MIRLFMYIRQIMYKDFVNLLYTATWLQITKISDTTISTVTSIWAPLSRTWAAPIESERNSFSRQSFAGWFLHSGSSGDLPVSVIAGPVGAIHVARAATCEGSSVQRQQVEQLGERQNDHESLQHFLHETNSCLRYHSEEKILQAYTHASEIGF